MNHYIRRHVSCHYLIFMLLVFYIMPVKSGFSKADEIEKVLLCFCKRLLGVKESTNTNMVYFELGRIPLVVKRTLQIFKYWLELLNTNNCILGGVYNVLKGSFVGRRTRLK